MELTLKSNRDFRIHLRLDGVKVTVIGTTPFSAKVVIPGKKTVRSIDPIQDTYEQMPLEEIKGPCKRHNVTRDELSDMCPPEYYFNSIIGCAKWQDAWPSIRMDTWAYQMISNFGN